MENKLLGNTKLIPLMFCIDTSDSMRRIWDITNIKTLGQYDTVEGEQVMLAEGGRTYLEDVKEKLAIFLEGMNKKLQVKYSTEVSLVTFGNEIKQDIPFTRIDKVDLEGKLDNPCGTSMFCTSFLFCLSLIEKKNSRLQKASNNVSPSKNNHFH